MKISEGQEWHTKVEDRAVGWAGGVSLSFEKELNLSLQRCPKKGVPERTFVFNTLFDTFIGALVMMIYKYGGLGSQQEEAVIQGVRAKFRSLREANLGAEHEMGEAKYEPDAIDPETEKRWKQQLENQTPKN